MLCRYYLISIAYYCYIWKNLAPSAILLPSLGIMLTAYRKIWFYIIAFETSNRLPAMWCNEQWMTLQLSESTPVTCHVSRVTPCPANVMLYKSQYSNEHCCTIMYLSSIKGQRPPTKHGQWVCMFNINWEFANISLISVGSAAVLAPRLPIVSTTALPSSVFRPYTTPTHKWFCIYIFTQLSIIMICFKQTKRFYFKRHWRNKLT